MKPVIIESKDFPGSEETIYARNQPQYLPLPVVRYPEGLVISKWEFTPEEIEKVRNGASLYIGNHTFNHPLQPIVVGLSPEEVR